ncbi:hypothetical protein P170DRAFT_479511 [Aspergillus steynii IBT 23096]|uniref:Uncharacterized protein n=1 Tax=Aspergillus steynii IBT 23096 TaxID=1392250 RepID=A0A2I2FWJ1_9EURO|nr:uncharacterized protein P170DRAFT_479511 [Aspergillus steynii IBT 23096]PLB44977.1 hypothetical protein P170DRAFT_479511 [Aspergillus steynii IBT 23096]
MAIRYPIGTSTSKALSPGPGRVAGTGLGRFDESTCLLDLDLRNMFGFDSFLTRPRRVDGMGLGLFAEISFPDDYLEILDSNSEQALVGWLGRAWNALKQHRAGLLVVGKSLLFHGQRRRQTTQVA